MMKGLKELIGKKLRLPNNWGLGEVCGGWSHEGVDHLLMAWPDAGNAKQLFNERLSAVLDAQEAQ